MTLLREVMERPLDPGYAAAAAAGRRRGARPPRGRRHARARARLRRRHRPGDRRAAPSSARGRPGQAALQAGVRRRSAAVDADQRSSTSCGRRSPQLQARSLAGGRAGDLAQQAAPARSCSPAWPRSPARACRSRWPTRPRRPPAPRHRPAGQRQADRRACSTATSRPSSTASGRPAPRRSRSTVSGSPPRSAIRYAGQAILVDFRPLVPPLRRLRRRRRRRPADPVRGQPGGGLPAGAARQLRDPGGYRRLVAYLELPGAGGTTTRFDARRAGPVAGRRRRRRPRRDRRRRPVRPSPSGSSPTTPEVSP